ncbi:MAG: hypothetical protein M0Z37_01950 [Nitrospiraceae bacterium]|nr:hypothetical protein [Nitrospiraceae bacterium]
MKNGENPGYPRFKGIARYSSLTFPQWNSGCDLAGNGLRLSKIGFCTPGIGQDCRPIGADLFGRSIRPIRPKTLLPAATGRKGLCPTGPVPVCAAG